MKTTKTKLAIAVLGCLYASGQVFGSPLLYDGFAGESLDTAKWTSGGFEPTITVADGALMLRNTGWSHNAFVFSKDNSFNFHQSSKTVSVEINSFAPANPFGTGDFAATQLWLSLGPATTEANMRSSNRELSGFSFFLRWGRADTEGNHPLSLRTEGNLGIGAPSLSEMPSQISFTVDATTFAITLEGATFLSAGSGTLSVDSLTITGMHTMGGMSFDNYHFMAMHRIQSMSGDSRAYISSVTVIPEPSTYAFVFGILALGFFVYRRRTR